MTTGHAARLVLLVVLVLALPGRATAREVALLDQRLAVDLAVAQVTQATTQPHLSVPAPASATSATDEVILRRLQSGRRLSTAGLWTMLGGAVAFVVGSAVAVNDVLSRVGEPERCPSTAANVGAIVGIVGLVAVPVGVVLLVTGNGRGYDASDAWRSAHPGVPVPP